MPHCQQGGGMWVVMQPPQQRPPCFLAGSWQQLAWSGHMLSHVWCKQRHTSGSRRCSVDVCAHVAPPCVAANGSRPCHAVWGKVLIGASYHNATTIGWAAATVVSSLRYPARRAHCHVTSCHPQICLDGSRRLQLAQRGSRDMFCAYLCSI